jgi:hypothetical protein
VAGETGTTVIGNAQTAVTAIGIATWTVNAVVIAKMDARISMKNTNGGSRVKMADVDNSAASRTKGAPLVAVLALHRSWTCCPHPCHLCPISLVRRGSSPLTWDVETVIESI